jgi:hypothetical protein
LKEELITAWQLKTACTIPLVLPTAGVITNRFNEMLKLLDLRPAPHILMQKAVTLNTCRIVRKLFAQQRVSSAWSVRPYCFGNRVNCSEVREVGGDGGGDNLQGGGK